MEAIEAVTGTWLCQSRSLRSYQLWLCGNCKMLGAPSDSKEKTALSFGKERPLVAVANATY
eukprot:GDKH01016999.1.p2 GENE.GDKH01016999.1~~GDKH01016999.1.p2  ORF type:complete len:61 (+),score=7.32 GDKH01016999.1:195-377(+)